jgi:hypothetical protein
MNNLSKIFMLLGVVIFMSSCQDEIEIDLNSADQKIIIEGEMSNEIGAVHTVKITKTLNFSDSNNFPPVKGAKVSISDNTGASETLTETEAGVYKTKKILGESGKIYTLTVVAEGQTFTAQSTMVKQIPLLGIKTLLNLNAFPPGSENTYIIFPLFKDPVGLGNAYRFIPTLNGVTNKEILAENDNGLDGLNNSRPIFSRDLKVKKGDTLTLEMRCLDPKIYDYFYSLNQSAGNGPGGGATPTNPLTNIKGGALGYFSAHTVEKKTIIVE